MLASAPPIATMDELVLACDSCFCYNADCFHRFSIWWYLLSSNNRQDFLSGDGVTGKYLPALVIERFVRKLSLLVANTKLFLVALGLAVRANRRAVVEVARLALGLCASDRCLSRAPSLLASAKGLRLVGRHPSRWHCRSCPWRTFFRVVRAQDRPRLGAAVL